MTLEERIIQGLEGFADDLESGLLRACRSYSVLRCGKLINILPGILFLQACGITKR